MPSTQSTSRVIMIRPACFCFNLETAISNAFQNQQYANASRADHIQQQALIEFNRMVEQLRSHGIYVDVFDDTLSPIKPDAIFPNNWFSTHPDGTIILYPMLGENRRLERRQNLIKTALRFQKNRNGEPNRGPDFSVSLTRNREKKAECAFILQNKNLRPEPEKNLCQVIVDICAQHRIYERYFDLLGQELCTFNKKYTRYFEEIFKDQYKILHTLENVQLQNLVKFYVHLFIGHSISWRVLDCCDLIEELTTPSQQTDYHMIEEQLQPNSATGSSALIVKRVISSFS
ncbi:unnamed protein product [Rotaria sordida]|uniref:MI domain-containing protein n=1 Tax=Rotaria sordida TaxID=392033 RepID=A0A819U013_9BILA|nr:unnamed protein product [Rotaria sordida]